MGDAARTRLPAAVRIRLAVIALFCAAAALVSVMEGQFAIALVVLAVPLLLAGAARAAARRSSPRPPRGP